MRLRKNQPGYRKSKDAIGRTTWVKEVAPAQQLEIQSDHPLGDFQAPQENHIDAQDVVDNLSAVGLYGYLAGDMQDDFYHSYSGDAPCVEAINDVVEPSDYTMKPKHAF